MARRARRTSIGIAGSSEAARLAMTLGGQVRTARRARHQPMRTLAKQVGLSTSRLSEVERGDGAGTPLEIWVRLGIALDRPIAVTFSRALDEPRSPADAGHLEIQEHMLALARATGRSGTFEVPTRPTDTSRSVDIGLRDSGSHVRIHVECWNTFSDLGAAVRATNRKAAEATATWPDDRIAVVWVVRASATNRAILGRFPHIIDASFPGSSRDWLRSLTDGTSPPSEPGLVWFDPATGRLMERRRATIAP
jgi:transcriptional regulator with XRE-family HTH domain